ncbi:hypothetical protein M422DRAFT_31104 [Sphaerobolus stellatus SS14]|uniref:Uncharacterized protein n=1 Tax=Sphaerobolus stellatus (strain SS14) TaxID=990650 RepID=A0A0C9VW93_SPHS4|nr:hypothetical protein M422DRAFT_49715 [Sphaerobolus stellatus SS14]KIJ43000.1 hypothetical protein M422DRAFT_31104 [Sphaerobolus stellatus SS14]
MGRHRLSLNEIYEEHPADPNEVRCKICNVGTFKHTWMGRGNCKSHPQTAMHLESLKKWEERQRVDSGKEASSNRNLNADLSDDFENPQGSSIGSGEDDSSSGEDDFELPSVDEDKPMDTDMDVDMELKLVQPAETKQQNDFFEDFQTFFGMTFEEATCYPDPPDPKYVEMDFSDYRLWEEFFDNNPVITIPSVTDISV